MAHLLFIDESGQDHRESPYEVLAGVAIEDRDLWNLIQAIQDAELRIFGTRYSRGHNHELKGKKLLKKKVFRHAGMWPLFESDERQTLAKSCLQDGGIAGKRELAALAQAKLAYVHEVFAICSRFRCKLFASIVTDEWAIAEHDPDYLRKDYSFLFERFYYYLEDISPNGMGIVVFDELEKSKSISCQDKWMATSSVRRKDGNEPAG